MCQGGRTITDTPMGRKDIRGSNGRCPTAADHARVSRRVCVKRRMCHSLVFEGWRTGEKVSLKTDLVSKEVNVKTE
jgi:hypothetical protein